MERINISYRKTKKNEIYRVPSEVYLHNTMNCGFGCCGLANPRIQEQIQHLKDFYILSDEFIQDFIYFVEEKEFVNIIITRTAMTELKKKYIHTFRRLERAVDRFNLPLVEDMYLKDIYQLSKQNSSTSYYKSVCAWYSRHIPGCTFTNVCSLREGCDMFFPSAMLSSGFVPLLPELRIKLSDDKYESYMSQEEIARIQERVETGCISIPSKEEDGEIVCNIDGHQIRIEIPKMLLNRAVDKDYVQVEIIDEAESKYIGKVVQIMWRSRKPFPCTLHKYLNSTHILLESEIDNIPAVVCQVPKDMCIENKVLLAVIEDWEETEEYPIGYIIRVIGEKGTIDAETAALLAHYSILDQPFERSAIDELPSENWKVLSEDILKREDLRKYPIASIDPEGCIDIDDALHALQNPDGTIEIGVHIADVTHFVKEASFLDREGRIRGCTTYLPNRRIDMLPSLLGTHLCSLHKNLDRLAFSVIWKIQITQDKKIQILDRRFTKSVIRSKESFTYDQASSILEKGIYSKSQDLLKSLQILKQVSVLLKKSRLDSGAFVIHSDECRISARNSKYFSEIAGNLKSYIISENTYDEKYDTHSLVEEFMLLANQHVATYISLMYPQESLIRVHPKPSPAAFKQLENALSFLSSSQVVLNPNNPSEFSAILKIYSNTPEMKSTIGAWITRCMAQAIYSSSAISCKLHYGLAMHNYTHFTSPIRRYADVIVHRILYNAINQERYSPVTEHTLQAICDSLNRSYRCTKWVARHANNIYIRHLIAGHTVNAVLTKISAKKIEVYLPYYGVSGNLYLSELLYLAQENVILQKSTQQIAFRLFSTVAVHLVQDVRKIFAFKMAI